MPSFFSVGVAHLRGTAFFWVLGPVLGALLSACGGSDGAIFDSSATSGGSTTTGSSTTTTTGTTMSTGHGGAGGAGHGGSGGSGGSGGTGGCSLATDCTDSFDCTIDSCNAGVCAHVPGPGVGKTACPAGQFCDALKGCVQGVACADTAQCLATFGGDACKTDIQCDPKTSVCTYQTLDKDHDGHPPPICNGDDCDDSDPLVYPGAPELCDGKDNDCDQKTDDGAKCPGLEVCQAGTCACPPANTCGNACVDLSSDAGHCGNCGHACPFAAVCAGAKCVCPGGGTECGGACVDAETDTQNCGACNVHCGAGFACVGGSCACPKSICAGACVDLAVDEQNCGSCNKVCPAASQCQSGSCVCAPSLALCGGQCVDTSSDLGNCGGCGVKCNGTCQKGACKLCPPVDLYLLQDLSGSMSAMLGNVDRLTACRQAIGDFMAEAKSVNVGLGVGYHPVQVPLPPTCNVNEDCGGNGFCFNGTCASGGDACNVADYSVPSVGIASLPGIAGTIQASLAGHPAKGGSTPPGALQGALSYAKSFAAANPTHKVGVVLVADGVPNICTANQNGEDLPPIAAQYAAGAPKVLTYVLAITTEVAKATWDPIAVAGGTGSAYVATSALEVQSALDKIRELARSCP